MQQLSGNRVRAIGASRTDAGVHAKGQVVAFQAELSLAAETVMRALNFYLPADIAVQACSPVADDFHPRRQALRREYHYTILNSMAPSPFLRRHALLVSRPLDVEAMDRACRSLIGQRDFAPFTSPSFTRHTKRTVYHAEVHRDNSVVCFRMVADSFLPQQVRRTVGPLLRVGLGKMSVADFVKLAEARQRGVAAPAAPPWGLCLMRVEYPDLEFDIA